jgi:hypothetical protein
MKLENKKIHEVATLIFVAIFGSLISISFISGCDNKGKNTSNLIVKNIGNTVIGDHGAQIRVFRDQNQLLNVEFKSVYKSGGKRNYSVRSSDEGYINPDKVWLIIVKNESEIWVFCNGNQLEKWFDSPKVGGVIGYHIDQLGEDVPVDVKNIISAYR